MESLLSKVTQQAMNYAIRSGIAITSGYAIRQCSRLIKAVEGDQGEEIAALQLRLESKIRIISPAIDMIELIAARGNTSLDSAVTLTKDIRWSIQSLGLRLAKAATDEELASKRNSKAKSKFQTDMELSLITADIKKLLTQIEDAVPLINLAITTSGVNLSTALPSTVSPSRLLQASTFLSGGDSRYAMIPGQMVQIGPVFTLSLYMLFSGHAHRAHDEESIRETTWKELIHKARVKIVRVPLDKSNDLPSSKTEASTNSTNGQSPLEEGLPAYVPSEGKAYEFAYQLLIIEDLNDDRVHTFDENEPQPGPFEDVALAGIREIIPIYQISKIFYADTGKILNIGTDGETNNPILLFKRDVNAVPPRRMMESREHDVYDDLDSLEDESIGSVKSENGEDAAAQILRESSVAPDTTTEPAQSDRAWRFPPNLDPEWIAFEVYVEEPDSDDEVESSLVGATPASRPEASRSSSVDPLISSTSRLRLDGRSDSSALSTPKSGQIIRMSPLSSPAQPHSYSIHTELPPLKTSLSLLELLIRLTALQQFQQSSHLAINDELLNFFLSESSTTGAGADSEYRKKVRRDARRRVGFDPYDESPIKRRGEEYLDQYRDEDEQSWHEGGSPYPSSPRRRESPGVIGNSPNRPPDFHRRRQMDRNSPDTWNQTPSPAQESSPSPRFKQSQKNPALPSRRSFGATTTTPKSRTEVLRGGVNSIKKQSPLGRSESDSALGTSPRTE